MYQSHADALHTVGLDIFPFSQQVQIYTFGFVVILAIFFPSGRLRFYELNNFVKNLNGDDVVIPPKDEEEIALEKLVFGDLEGFETNLRKVENLYEYSSDEDEQEQGDSDKFFKDTDEEEDESDLENVQDNDLFFIDDAGDQQTNDEDAMEIDREESEAEMEEDNAWEDSDDERLNVSLTSSDRLKKLRKHEHDSSISGKSYIIRLRSQFEKIYPKPEWVDKLRSESETVDSDNEIQSDDEGSNSKQNDTNAILKILSSTQQFIMSKQSKLIPPNKISISRLTDANQQKRAKSDL
ncbi:hypothetical protein QCA50_016261 [Cerrena zonata]|uniref:Protein TIC 214 n=1 Tax=Cerrena zonata TaxID=2478898 RepID=A0AAW0FG38_9APHY